MESFLKKAVEKKIDEDTKRYFLRFGKGKFNRRFLISFNKGNKIKLKGSFEWANDFVIFAKENGVHKFSGKVMTRDKIPGMDGKKKGGVFVYEIEEEGIENFKNVYYYLLNANNSDIVLNEKKALPKPGKDAEKIDDGCCVLELDLKHWDVVKKTFFWDAPECKKCVIEHTLEINNIDIPSNTAAEKIRERAVRKGRIIRKMECDGKMIEKIYEIEV